MTSLLEQLPKIVADGKRAAEQILDRLESNYRIGLQTRELVIPSKDSNWKDLFATHANRQSTLDSATLNRLIYGDNLLAIAALLAGDETTPSMRGKIDLIYIDPPFDSKADYRTTIEMMGSSISQNPTVLEQFGYTDTWHAGTSSYLQMIAPRLFLMRELLSDTGTIFVHLDWHVGHYVKIILDEVFGRDRFINEIVWHYYNKMQGNVNHFPKNHDVIFWYKKGEKYTFNKIKEERPEKKKQLKRVWSKEKQKIVNAKDESGNVIYIETDEKGIDDVWYMSMLQPADKKENLKYNTQKPELLVSTVISAATKEGDIVADFFVGSGTTASVAEKLGRRWIVSDLGKPACMLSRKRMVNLESSPFLYQQVGDYQVEQARSTLGRKFRVGDLSQIIVGLFGALPLPPEENPNRNLGRFGTAKHLVYVDSPNKLTGLTTLKRAIQLRESHMGGWDKVTVLGWNFEPGIGEALNALDDDRLEVLVIPPDLLDRLKKKGKKLKADEVRFSSLQYLVLGKAARARNGSSETLTIELGNYVLLSPEALNLDDDNRKKLEEIVNNDPLALIEYWSVDPNYDGEVFRSVWQDYRENTENDDDPYRVVTTAQLDGLEAVDGPRKVCVRVIDVFGFEAEAIVEVSA